MAIFFEILKGLFFLSSVVIAVFYLNGGQILTVFGVQSEVYEMLKVLMMPGYLILCGLMLGYIIAHLRIVQQDDDEQPRQGIYVKSFIIGIFLGIVLALISLFVS
ncbi:MAG TPA: hypothetical protein PKD96_00355 [Candidatus Absconditabacterales bacterium]|nr:hypothetical protein [Candidatus Absconditabacterales bacterium]HMT26731.1 hypothetical protein [Candidatus Absconditabacterales bacterium]